MNKKNTSSYTYFKNGIICFAVTFFLVGCGSNVKTSNVQKIPQNSTNITKTDIKAPEPITYDEPVYFDASSPIHLQELTTQSINTEPASIVSPPKNTEVVAGRDSVVVTAKNYRRLQKTVTEQKSLYSRIRNGFSMSHNLDNAKVQKYIKHYQKYPSLIIASLNRATPFLYYITEQVDKRNLPMELVLLPIVESSYKTTAKSIKNAVGLWQFISSTGRYYGLHSNWLYEGRRDVVKSTDAALNFLSTLVQKNKGDWEKSLASYNAGFGTILKAEKKYFRVNNFTKATRQNYNPSYWELDLPQETENYVPKLLAAAAIIADPEFYGFQLPEIINAPVIKVVTVNQQIDLKKVITTVSLKPKHFVALNPGYKRHTTPSNTDNHLILPIAEADKLEKLLQLNNDMFKVNGTYYRVRSGDTLSEIAYNYGISVNALKKLNALKTNTIYPNKRLLIYTDGSKLKQIATNKKNNTKKSAIKQNNTQFANNHNKRTLFAHKVTKGDSLYSIAQNYNVKIGDLLNWNNNLNKNSILKIGRKLTIYKPSNPNVYVTHHIRKKDSLWLISNKYNVAIADIKLWNNLESTEVNAGDKLLIKVGHKGG